MGKWERTRLTQRAFLKWGGLAVLGTGIGQVAMPPRSAFAQVFNEDVTISAGYKLGVGVSPTETLHVDAGTLGAGCNAVYVTATLPANPLASMMGAPAIAPLGSSSGNSFGIYAHITSAGSSNNANIAGAAVLFDAGYTGDMATMALEGWSQVAGTASSENWEGNYRSNSGVLGGANAVGTGARVGTLGIALNGNRNSGLAGVSIVDKADGVNIGVAGYGRNDGADGVQIGGFFGLYKNGYPAFVSAALLADNGGQAVPIFVARDNGAEVFRIDDGGNVGIGLTGPGEKLDVAGNVRLSGQLKIGSTVIADSGGAYYAP